MEEKLRKFEIYLKNQYDVNEKVWGDGFFKDVYEIRKEILEDALETFKLFGLSQEACSG